MTSVLSRLQLSSGSKILILFLVFTFVSCNKKTNDYFRDTQKVRVDDGRTSGTKKRPKTTKNSSQNNDNQVDNKKSTSQVDETRNNNQQQGSNNDTTQPVSTAPQTDIDQASTNPYEEYDVKKGSYKVAMLAPFNTNETVTENTNDRFLQYFGGMVIASEVLNKEGHNIDIRIIDTKNKSIDNVLRSELAPDTDVIVGPYASRSEMNNLYKTIDYGKNNQITVVSPWASLKSRDSEFYVQLSPNMKEYYKSLMKKITQRHYQGNVYIIGRTTSAEDQKIIKYCQTLASFLWGTNNTTPLNTIYITEQQLNDEDPVFLPAMERDRESIFIVPNLRPGDNNYVYNVLRRVSLEKSLNNVTVYGMSNILDNSRVDFELYNTLDLRVLSPRFIDNDNVNVQNFRRMFFEKFGTLPDTEAYRGYDNFIWLGKSLTNHGVNFRYKANDSTNDNDYLQELYNIKAIKRKSDADTSPLYFQNTAIDLIEFKDGKFVRSK